MFSSRVPPDLAPNRLARAVAHRRAEGLSLVDLTESNPTRAGFRYPPDLLAPLADPRGLVYDPQPLGSREARSAVAADYARRGIPVDAGQIVLTASTSEAYSMLFKLLADPGEEVLAPRPSYPLFEHLTRLDSLIVRPYDLEYHGVWSVDVGTAAEAFSARTRALLVVQPNNPTGSFLRRADLDWLASRCAEHEAAIISDEVFGEYELGDDVSDRGKVASRRDVLSFELGGLSKSIGMPQLKLGWILVNGPAPLANRALEQLEFVGDSYLSVSTPVQVAARELLERGAEIRAQIQARVSANYRELLRLAETTAACRVLRAEGGWYAILEVPAIDTEEDLVVDLVEREGVLVHPGYFFDFQREAYLVLSLLVSEAQFASAAECVLRHCDARARA
jgi:alanine-synthesizing transaminase